MQITTITRSGYVPHLDTTRNPLTGDIYIAVTKDTAAGPCNCEIVKRSPNGARALVAVFAEDTRAYALYPGVMVAVVGKAGHCAIEWTPEGLFVALSARVNDEYGERQAYVEALLPL